MPEAYDFSICSDDLPPPFEAPWFKRSRWEEVVNSSKFSETDDPDRLRLTGADAVASAIVQLAESGLTDPRSGVREAARLLLEYFAERHFHYEPLDYFLGLRRRDGKSSLSYRDRLAERDAVVAEMAVADRWADLAPRDAAKAMKREFGRWEASVLPRLKADRKTRPALEPDEWFWRIAQTERGLPNEATLKVSIEVARADCRDFYSPMQLF